MLRPVSGNGNEAPVFQAPRGCKGHTLFIVSILFFSTVLSDLIPVSLSAIPGPSGEHTVCICSFSNRTKDYHRESASS